VVASYPEDSKLIRTQEWVTAFSEAQCVIINGSLMSLASESRTYIVLKRSTL